MIIVGVVFNFKLVSCFVIPAVVTVRGPSRRSLLPSKTGIIMGANLSKAMGCTLSFLHSKTPSNMNHTNRQDLRKQGNAVIDAWFGRRWKDKYVSL